MTVQRYVEWIRRWLWLIVLGALLAGAAGRFVSERQTRIYQASIRLIVNPDSTSGALAGSDVLDRLAATYSEMLVDRPIMQETVSNLGLPISPEELRGIVKVDPVRGTSLLELKVEYPSPEVASHIANEIPKVFLLQQRAADSARAAATLASMQKQLEDAQAELDDAQRRLAFLQVAPSANQPAIERQQGELAALQTGYNELYQQYASLRTRPANETPALTATAAARALPTPIRPNTTQNTLASVLAGAILAIAFAFLFDLLDQGFIGREQVEKELLLPVFGTVPGTPMPGIMSELPIMSAAHRAQGEAYRVLRTNLEVASGQGKGGSLLIASPSSHEGRSVTAANLAAGLAQNGHKVILVDADLHQPRLHSLFRIPNHTGLSTVLLSRQADVMQLLQTTEARNLRVLTSGHLPPNPAELLGSDRMAGLIATLSQHADFVIFDSPPASAVADAVILATKVDRVLLVLDAKHTRMDIAREVLAAFRQVQARMAGVVLNRTPKLNATYRYGYHGDYYRSRSEVQADSAVDNTIGRKAGYEEARRSAPSFRPAESPAEDVP